MINLPNVTLVSVSCVRVHKAVRALRKCMNGLKFKEAILVTDEKLDLSKYGIKVVQVEKLDYKGYNQFVLYRLKDVVKTDYALLVQDDGYVLRPEKWTDEFLKYDYIGAPWPKDLHFTKEGVNVRVGNGGFSFRSRKLMEAPTRLGLEFTDNGVGYFNEDGNLCVYHRKTLEDNGVKFAPVSVASMFSREVTCPDSYDKPFGFHARRDGLPGLMIHVEKLGRRANKHAKNFYGKVAYKTKTFSARIKKDISALKNDLTPIKNAEEYRKKIKVYDIFTFFNELDLLEMRLNILDPYVEFFVIIEATTTFSGNPKPLHFELNKSRFAKWQNKIIHYVTDDAPKDKADLENRLRLGKNVSGKNLSEVERYVIDDVLSHNTVGARGIDWTRELYQKESMKKALVGLSDDDICYISDVDEIWDPRAKIDFSKDRIYRLRQLMYAYYLNNRSSEPWVGPLVAKYKIVKKSYLNDLRSDKKSGSLYTYVNGGGWHFTNMGGADQIRKKLESYGHQEYNTPELKAAIEKMMLENKDFIGRGFKFWVDDGGLPKYILENRSRYERYFK